MAGHRIDIDKEKCVGCGLCEKDCVAHNIELEKGKANVFLMTVLCAGIV